MLIANKLQEKKRRLIGRVERENRSEAESRTLFVYLYLNEIMNRTVRVTREAWPPSYYPFNMIIRMQTTGGLAGRIIYAAGWPAGDGARHGLLDPGDSARAR